MTDRERLVKLIRDKTCGNNACVPFLDCEKCGNFPLSDKDVDRLADHILADGWMRSPCKVGDVVYRIYTRSWVGEDVVRELMISENGVFYIDDKGRMTSCNKFGKTVFLTREDAEKALEGE